VTPRRRSLIFRAWRFLWRLASDRSYRNIMWLYWARPKAAFQPFNDTRENRYPVIFGFIQAALNARPVDGGAIAILSFGCSTGEEVFTLRRYFPAARIKGLDINPANIAICEQRLAERGDSRIAFARAESTRGEADGAYDAVFCMAVLRHGSLGDPNVTRCDHLLRFEDFENAVADFSRCLRSGGLLAMAHSNFRFADTRTSADFETLLTIKSQVPLFGRDNRRLTDAGDTIGAVFRKLR
jgi:SAM-dependent methyltransferase